MYQQVSDENKYIIDDLNRGKPKSREWKLFCDTLGWKIYSLIDRETGYYQFKSFGTVKHSADVVINSMYNAKYRKEWDSSLADFKKVGRHENKDIVYWDVTYPMWLMDNRDYVLSVKIDKISEKLTVGAMVSSDAVTVRKKSGRIRVGCTN